MLIYLLYLLLLFVFVNVFLNKFCFPVSDSVADVKSTDVQKRRLFYFEFLQAE